MPWAQSSPELDPLLTYERDDASSVAAGPKGTTASVDRRFVQSLLSIIKYLRPYAATGLSVLAVLEILVVAQVGKVTGNYYRILLDKEWDAFWRVTGVSALLYIAATLLQSTTVWLSEILAVRWRGQLGRQLQQQYLEGDMLYKAHQQCDNPDQRMVQDLDQFSGVLALVLRKLAATPFKVVLYGAWTASVASWQPLGLILAFFLLGLCIQRSIMSPIAGLICRQEQLEGDLRFAHMRIRAGAEQILMWGGNAAELADLQKHLQAAVGNQRALVYWRWLLSAVTCALDYAGAVLNFMCVALPVAAGAFAEAGDTGKAAQRISNASFATLSLIYSLTEVLDLADSLSTLAGLTARVADLRQVLEGAGARGWHSKAARKGKVLRQPWLLETARGRSMELSVHALGPEMRRLAGSCFANAPSGADLLAVCTIQGPVPSEDAGAMDEALDTFAKWQAAVAQKCAAAGWWCDAADPSTGFSLRGPRRQRWNEVRAAHWLLGYPLCDEDSICPRMVHPSFGTDSYLASLLTAAPLPVLLNALHESREVLLGASHETPPLSSPSGAASTSQSEDGGSGGQESWQLVGEGPSTRGKVLAIEGLTCFTGQQRPVVRNFSLDLPAGGSVLLRGASGAGKTTLLRALRGLWPCHAAWLEVHAQAVFVAQRPFAAPGATLREQLVYPSARQAAQEHLWKLLQAVQLGHLLARVCGDWERPHDWEGELSLGELQRLAFARVLHAGPALAVLDEPVSALSREQGQHLLGLLQEQGTAILCTGQLDCPRTSLFSRVVTLSGDDSGSWHSILQ